MPYASAGVRELWFGASSAPAVPGFGGARPRAGGAAALRRAAVPVSARSCETPTSSPRVARAALTSDPRHSQGASTCPASFWLAIALASAFLVVASVAFSASTTTSLAIGIARLVMSAGVAYEYRRRRIHHPAAHDDRAMAAASSQHSPHAT